MARIVIQMGHVARTTGATGTHREQEFVRAVGPQLQTHLRALGHTVFLIGADDPVPRSEVFVALHTDGNANRDIRGASVGYPDDAGGQLAAAWKRAHQRAGYPAGFHPDNYTKNLRYYYGFGRSSARWRFLAEHGTTTNLYDEAWLFGHMGSSVIAHVEAIGEIVGHPRPQPTPQEAHVALIQAGQKAVAVIPAPDQNGYLIVASDGAVYAFPATLYKGGANGIPHAPIVDACAQAGGGYVLLAEDGAIYAYPGDLYKGGAN